MQERIIVTRNGNRVTARLEQPVSVESPGLPEDKTHPIRVPYRIRRGVNPQILPRRTFRVEDRMPLYRRRVI